MIADPSAETVPFAAGVEPSDTHNDRPYDIVVVASSAGGVHALMALVEGIPASFDISVVVVQHLDPNHPSLLVDILSRHALLPVEQAVDGTALDRGVIVVAPPGHHLVIRADHSLELSDAEPVHFVRPSADVLFESAAAVFGARVIAMVLTGTGSDGAQGVDETGCPTASRTIGSHSAANGGASSGATRCCATPMVLSVPSSERASTSPSRGTWRRSSCRHRRWRLSAAWLAASPLPLRPGHVSVQTSTATGHRRGGRCRCGAILRCWRCP